MVTAKSFNILATSLSVLHNYFDSSNKIVFRSVIKFLNTSEKSFFPCIIFIEFLLKYIENYHCSSQSMIYLLLIENIPQIFIKN